MSLLGYPGRVPSNVNKDAKYSIKHVRDGMEVTVLYPVGPGERELLATADHAALVEMVNAVKVAANGAPGGSFYINEFRDVIVPSTSGVAYFAGIYEPTLEFNLEGAIVSAKAAAGLRPGNLWPGPRAGVAYVLAAGGNDIYYMEETGSRQKKILLSQLCDEASARALAQRLAKIKGTAGGRIYINEECEIFDPATNVYLGSLDDDPWFPPPDVPGRA
jgi:hypothetical protein